MNVSRRGFIGGLVALAVTPLAKILPAARGPMLRVGPPVVLPLSEAMLIEATKFSYRSYPYTQFFVNTDILERWKRDLLAIDQAEKKAAPKSIR